MVEAHEEALQEAEEQIKAALRYVLVASKQQPVQWEGLPVCCQRRTNALWNGAILTAFTKTSQAAGRREIFPAFVQTAAEQSQRARTIAGFVLL